MIPRPAALELLAALAVTVLLAAPAAASRAEKERDLEERQRIAALPAAHRLFLEEVELLLSPAERSAFLALAEDYQRLAFIEGFWRARDPYPETSRNELRERWRERTARARDLFGKLDDDRARILLLNGEPAERHAIRCPRLDLWPLEVWYYGSGNRTRDPLFLIFHRRWGAGPFLIWQPQQGVGELWQEGGSGLAWFVRERCVGPEGDALFAALTHILDRGVARYPLQLVRAMAPPTVSSEEWLASFGAYLAEVPADAPTFSADLSFAFTGRHQSRTIVEVMVRVAAAQLARYEGGGARSYNLVVTGALLQEEEIFDRFRYRFDFAADGAGELLPLVFQRPLRPGNYRLLLRAEDVNGKRFYSSRHELVVPHLAGDQLALPTAAGEPDEDGPWDRAGDVDAAGRDESEVTLDLFRPIEALVGKVRFDVAVSGERVDHLAFALDGRQILVKHAPPWSVELDLGDEPRRRVLQVTAHDATGRQLAAGELVLDGRAPASRLPPQGSGG